MNKIERQNKLVQAIETNHQLTAAQLAKTLKVSKRTILRDIQDLEKQGVQIIAKQGMLGGYQIQSHPAPIQLELNEAQMLALFMTLNESQSYSRLPYKKRNCTNYQEMSQSASNTYQTFVKTHGSLH